MPPQGGGGGVIPRGTMKFYFFCEEWNTTFAVRSLGPSCVPEGEGESGPPVMCPPQYAKGLSNILRARRVHTRKVIILLASRVHAMHSN